MREVRDHLARRGMSGYQGGATPRAGAAALEAALNLEWLVKPSIAEAKRDLE